MREKCKNFAKNIFYFFAERFLQCLGIPTFRKQKGFYIAQEYLLSGSRKVSTSPRNTRFQEVERLLHRLGIPGFRQQKGLFIAQEYLVSGIRKVSTSPRNSWFQEVERFLQRLGIPGFRKQKGFYGAQEYLVSGSRKVSTEPRNTQFQEVDRFLRSLGIPSFRKQKGFYGAKGSDGEADNIQKCIPLDQIYQIYVISRDGQRVFNRTKQLRTNKIFRKKGVVQKIKQDELFREIKKSLGFFFKTKENKTKTNDFKSFELTGKKLSFFY